MNILVVDDDYQILHSVAGFLRELGHRVDAYDNALKALDAFKNCAYDLALTDIKMPQMSAFDLLEATSILPKKTALVFITEKAYIESAILALRYGVFDYLLKPINFQDLISILNRVNLKNQELKKAAGFLNVILLHKESVLGEGLRFILQTANNINLVGLASTEEECRTIIEDRRIDIILIGKDSLKEYDLAYCQNLQQEYPGIKVAALTASCSSGYVNDVLAIGIKDKTGAEILEEIKSINRPHSPPGFMRSPLSAIPVQTPGLSFNEHRILLLVTKGKTNKEIAEELHLSPKTVRNYLSNVLQKLNIPNRTAAAVYASKNLTRYN